LMTDNDRELIELAANAVGYTFLAYHQPTQDSACMLSTTWSGPWAEVIKPSAPLGNCRWNPLNNDADAFRLMVELQISVTPCFGSTYIDAGGQLDFSHVHNNETALAGVRRAIVMMAAEIGRGME